jgi:uncharacterized protein (TIGR00369 family)
MKEFQKTINTVLSRQNLTEDYLQTIPDITSETFKSSLIAILMDAYNEKIPFDKFLGIKVIELNLERSVIAISSREELQGNYVHKILHGGVISAVIDLSGGIIAQLHAMYKMEGMTIAQMMHRFSKMSTLNMRVDYLRPGAGENFQCIAKVARAGNKVAVVQMEMFNEKNEQIAIGTGSYLIG